MKLATFAIAAALVLVSVNGTAQSLLCRFASRLDACQPIPPPADHREPTVVSPFPTLPPPEILPAPSPESWVELPRPRPKSVERQPKPKAKSKPPVVLDDSPVECWKVQWGASMSCNVIRANEHIYEGYSHRRKCDSRACLTPEQIKGIESCFPVKKPKLKCP